MFRKEFAEFLTNSGILTYKEVRPLLLNKRNDVVDELELLKIKSFDDKKVAQLISSKTSIPYIDLSKAKIPQTTLVALTKTMMVKYRCIPIQKTERALTVAIFDPTVVGSIQNLSQDIKMPVEMIVTNLTSWKMIIEQVKQSVDELLDQIVEIKGDSAKDEIVKEEDIGDDIITYVNKILAEAFVQKASDIHIEPYEKRFRIRFRIDGELAEVSSPSRSLMAPIISRLKIMAQMDISEKRKPQDGRIKLRIGDRFIDYRVSSLPTLFGEKIVLRLLDQSNLQVDMTSLGFERKQLEDFKESIHRPFGMCLVTGPTGSGKTTTLYSALTELNTLDTNISTAEDPVEFNLEGINQVNVKKDIGLTFASCLKAFLRQDPDVIMVGEIRDVEVGEIAVEAALTGHLVLSTLHTNDAAATITRMVNMGIEPFLVTAAVNVIVAQRLCRKICQNCKVPEPITPEVLISCGFPKEQAPKVQVFKGKGCEKCNKSGYKGRVAVYEVMKMTQGLRDLILAEASADDIKKLAIKEGMKSLRMSALSKAVEGMTTLDEAVSKTGSDDK